MSRRDSIQSRMRRMVVASCGFMAAVLAVTLALVLVYNGQYKNLLYNVTTASEFNQDFKENIDLKMYYYVIESRYSEGLPIQEVQAAQDLAKDLLNSTSQKDSLQAVTSVLDLCENLEEKIYQIEQTQSYDSRQMQLENNVYVLTALIQEYMYNYLYCESVQLNLLQQQISRQMAAEARARYSGESFRARRPIIRRRPALAAWMLIRGTPPAPNRGSVCSAA